MYLSIMPETLQLRTGESVKLKLYGMTMDNSELLLAPNKVKWEIYGDEGAATITEDGMLTARKTGEIVINAKYTVSSDKVYEDAIIINLLPQEENTGSGDNSGGGNNGSTGGNNRRYNNEGDNKESKGTGASLRRNMKFKANEEINLPGQIRIRFTGEEEVQNGYFEVYEIEDLMKYRQLSGKKDFVSNIFDISIPEGYKLKSPVELTIYFNKNKVKDFKRLAIYVYNEKTGLWDLVGGIVDEVQGTITVRLSHFSKYAVMENSQLIIMTDLDNHWAKDAVYRLVDKGIVNGIVNGIKYADGDYRYEPEKPVARAEFSKMLALASGYEFENNNVDLSNFADDKEILAWIRSYLKYCNEKGWINGKAVYMKPNDTITRAEAGVMVSIALGFTASNKNIKAPFANKKEIPEWAAVYIDELVNKKLMKGLPDGTFRPNEVMNCSDVVSLIDNYIRMQNDSY